MRLRARLRHSPPLELFYATGPHQTAKGRSRRSQARRCLRAQAAVEGTAGQPVHAGGIAPDERRLRRVHDGQTQTKGHAHQVSMELPKVYDWEKVRAALLLL